MTQLFGHVLEDGNGKVVAVDDGVDGGASDARGRAEGVRPRLGSVGVKGVGGGVGGLVGVACIGVLELAMASYAHGWSHARMCSLALTTAAVMRPSAIFVGLTRVTPGTEPVGRRMLATGGVGARRRRCATSMAARESAGT